MLFNSYITTWERNFPRSGGTFYLFLKTITIALQNRRKVKVQQKTLFPKCYLNLYFMLIWE